MQKLGDLVQELVDYVASGGLLKAWQGAFDEMMASGFSLDEMAVIVLRDVADGRAWTLQQIENGLKDRFNLSPGLRRQHGNLADCLGRLERRGEVAVRRLSGATGAVENGRELYRIVETGRFAA